ncbi:MarR family transcriptional regulator [Streptomyces sp. NPDC005438]|uniref:MarR family winged helix-turn-helix transcriptional regulator n=1 Tax=Streptomyces sp. NPDC005438 TaxID=3156880 RepID=UPI0033A95C7F
MSPASPASPTPPASPDPAAPSAPPARDDSRARQTAPLDEVTLEVLSLFGEVSARYHEEYDRAASRHGLSGAQARVLSLLYAEPLPMRQVARVIRCEPSNITGIVDRLEERGLVERQPNPADRRVKLAALTDEGRRVVRELRDNLPFARQPLAALTTEQRLQLRDLLRRVLGERE